MITWVLSGAKQGKALDSVLERRTGSTQSPLSPYAEVIRPQEAEPDIADTRPPLPHPALTSTHTAWHHLSMLTPDSLLAATDWFTSSDMVTEDGKAGIILEDMKVLRENLRRV